MRTRSLPHFGWGLLVAVSFAFSIPGSALAVSVCCKCKAPDSDKKDTCLQLDTQILGEERDCTTLPKKAVLEDGWECDKVPLSDNACKAISDNNASAICADGPKSALTLGGEKKKDDSNTGSANTQNNLPFSLNVSIPGFNTSGVSPTLFGDYLVAAFRYMISIVAVATTVMFIWGAFLYMVGSTGEKVEKGKEIMKDAVIGLALVLGATTILRTLNPALLSTSLVEVTPINTTLLDEAAPSFQGTGRAGTPDGSVVSAIITGAQKAGVDPCLLLAICEHETGMRPIWNGWPRNEKEKAICFGTCQVDARFLHDNNAIVKKARLLYPDFPPESPKATKYITDKEELLKRGEWMLTNVEGSAYIAGSVLRDSIRANGNNELLAVAAYGAGTGSMKNWRKANNCSPIAGLKIKDATQDSIKQSCIPHSVGIPVGKNPANACPEDKFNCSDPKANEKAEFVGTCKPTGKQCFAMVTDGFVQYAIKAYPRMVSTYQCDK